MNVEKLVQFCVFHVVGCDLEWWTSAINRVGARRAEKSHRFEAFHSLLASVLPPDKASAFGVALTNLDVSHQWLLLVTTDEFLDQEIISHETEESWDQAWDGAVEFYKRGFEYIADNPSVVDRQQLDHAWWRLRAALS